ncbi:MAG: phosphatidylglycerophosphatase A [Ignavibacteria bacterium]|nr:phosphatidylglycerophosphatase A [Ignavibacteria bacterium]
MTKKITNVYEWISTCGGIGLLPIMPGSWCSLFVAIPGIVFLAEFQIVPVVYAVLAVLFFVVGLLATKKVQGAWGTDPTEVVIDEAAGMSLVMVAPIIYTGWEYALGGLFLFRVFDVMKPWPISYINNKTGAWSVMVDDVLAGLFAVIALYLGSAVIQTALLFFLNK